MVKVVTARGHSGPEGLLIEAYRCIHCKVGCLHSASLGSHSLLVGPDTVSGCL